MPNKAKSYNTAYNTIQKRRFSYKSMYISNLENRQNFISLAYNPFLGFWLIFDIILKTLKSIEVK